MAEFDLSKVNEMYFDILKEIGNIGAGNATTALAQMLSLSINMEVPKVELLPVSELGGAISNEEDTVVGILIEISEDMSGSMMFLMDLDSAHYLLSKLIPPTPDQEEEFSEMEMSALKEIGNIISGSYLSALSTLTQLKLNSSIPYLSVDMAGAILSVPATLFGMYGDDALLIETQLKEERVINGFFILLPEPDSYSKLLSSLGVQI